MRRSLESLGRSRNMDMPKKSEGTANYADKPKTFEEHMRELKGFYLRCQMMRMISLLIMMKNMSKM